VIIWTCGVCAETIAERRLLIATNAWRKTVVPDPYITFGNIKIPYFLLIVVSTWQP
jgi:hypothetical protein